MSLIAAVWSPEDCFAITADGLQHEIDAGSFNAPRENEHAQKIFHTSFANGTGFAFGCCGATKYLLASGRRIDFPEITQQVMSDLPNYAHMDNVEDYFNRIAIRIFNELPKDISFADNFETDLCFVGFLNGFPVWLKICFPHSKKGFFPPVITGEDYSLRTFRIFCGSQTVFEQLRDKGLLSQPLNPSEAVEMVHRYAQTCIESNQTVPDCANLGGHVHVASVTPQGFQWIIPPC